MPNYWGIDSCELSTYSGPKTNNKTLLEYVTEQLGKPDFWGRYIGGNHSCPNGVLTNEEINYLQSNNIRTMLIYNGASKDNMLTEQQGSNDAKKAIDLTATLAIDSADHEVIIYLDIEESWKPTDLYLQGWSKTFFNSEFFRPGFYCNTASPNFYTAFCSAKLVSPEVDKTILYTTQPQLNNCPTKEKAPDWDPIHPNCTNTSSLDHGVQVWQYKENCLEELIDLNLMTSFSFDRTF
ncbi:hypothetical protein COE95_13070 [Bacillus toyonensis]|uniref:glycoside hydrolase domain-containing protein n=1 Tax=Bacillus toyonensis TaxID=155322 RepID=UPI000BF841DF|nr:glycoside hydrolase domain-containing protein [Bacillus toyonensis]PEP90523.1 hypothetical protein CN583_17395 [Bacillus toyonensis]PHC31183.1 hypothetical protein COE95_13070 [Bacillus toyonensis]